MKNTHGLFALSKEKPLVSEQGTILLIGAAGQIGEHVQPILEQLYPGKIIAVARRADTSKNIQALDFKNTDAVLNLIKDRHVEVVINLAAFLSSRSEAWPDEAREVNFTAVKRLLEGSKDLGVKQIFTPSSIAVYGADTGRTATMQSPTRPSGVYGKSKVELEQFMRDWNQRGEGAFATSLRLGGVLTCKLPPSDGTAMEFDKMILAAAYEAQTGQRYPELREYYDGSGQYNPRIPSTTRMPFILVDDAAREIVRYLHNVERTDPNATRHHLAAFTLGINDLADALRQKTKDGFKASFGPTSTIGPKARFAMEWPNSLDITSSRTWGFDPAMCANADKAIHTCFDRVQDSQKDAARTRTAR